MPINKNAFLRYRIIDKCLCNPQRRHPGMPYIIEKIEEQLGTGISESMFSKDIQQMKSIYNAPIKYNRFHNGYEYTEPNFTIREFPLTHDEVEALDMSTALLQQLKGTKMFQLFENAINKVIEGYRISDIIGKSEHELIQVEEPVRSDSSHWLEPILKGIVEKACLHIRYQSFDKETKSHDVSPYLLKEYRNRWYLIGYSNPRGKILVMALDRIKELQRCTSAYMPDDGFMAADFFNYSFGITQLHDVRPEEVVLSFTSAQAPYILSQPLHHSQKVISETEKGVQVQLHVYLTVELRMAVLSYGSEVEVLKPAKFRKEIEGIINKMAAVYEG